jgi:hypothetical protein
MSPAHITTSLRRLLGLTVSPPIKISANQARLGLEALELREVPSVTAVGDFYAVHQGKTLDVLSPGVLDNDSNSDGYTLTASLVSGPSHASSFTLLSGGRFQYRPAAGYVGPDSFMYRASDGHGGTADATVDITVTNAAPVAAPDSYAVAMNTSLRVSAPGVLGNDFDADSDHLNAVQISGPSHGRLWLTYDGSFVYTPDTGYAGPDSFDYKVFDGAQYSQPMTVGINVNAPNPNANPDTVTAHGITPVPIAVLANDSDPTNYPLTVTDWTQPSAGSLSFDANTNTFTYTPSNRLATANDSFQYMISNGHGGTTSALVTIQRVFWASQTGGDWSNQANWNAGILPNAEDDIALNLAATETVQIPNGFSADIYGLHSTARLAVNGSLTLHTDSTISGELAVAGTVTVAVPNVIPTIAPGDELSALPYLGTAHGLVLSGGGDITGQIVTQTGSQTVLTNSELRLGGTGSLNGGGWYSVKAATLLLNGAAATLNNLYTGNGATIGGNADLTLTGISIIQDTTFTGPELAVLDNRGFMNVLAEQPAKKVTVIIDRTVANNQTLKVSNGEITVLGGSGITVSKGATLQIWQGSSISAIPLVAPNAVIQNEGVITVSQDAGKPPAFFGVHVQNGDGLIQIDCPVVMSKLTQDGLKGVIQLTSETDSELQITNGDLSDGKLLGPGTLRVGDQAGKAPGFLNVTSGLSIQSPQIIVSGGSRATFSSNVLRQGATLRNYGTTTLRGNTILNNTIITNLSDATLEVIADENGAQATISAVNLSEISNSGTMVIGKSKYYADSKEFTATFDVPISNFGTMSVTRGTTDVVQGIFNTGTIATNEQTGMESPTTSITFRPATHQFGAGTTFVGPGTVRNGGDLLIATNVDFRVPGRFEMLATSKLLATDATGSYSAKSFIWYGGTITKDTTVEVRNGDTLFLQDSNAGPQIRIIDAGKLLNRGQVRWQGTGNLLLTSNGRWETEGGNVLLEVPNVSVLKDPNQLPNVAGRVEVRNGGTWTLLPGAGAITIEVPFALADGVVQLSGMTFKAGYSQSAGTSLIGTGFATVMGDVSITGGTLQLGLGVLNASGDITFGANATCEAGLADNTNGQITSGGTVSLAGTLSVIQSFTVNPPVGTRFSIMTAATKVQGNFTAFNGMPIGNAGDVLNPDLTDPKKYDLLVSNNP